MAKLNCSDFEHGRRVKIREVLKENRIDEKSVYFQLALDAISEKMHVLIKPEYADLIKPEAILFYAKKPNDILGYAQWKNGTGTIGVVRSDD